VEKGFLKGAYVTEVFNAPGNDVKAACSSKAGLKELNIKFSVITFKTEKTEIVCYGSGTETFVPGLRSQ
jgi:hypothetical protein